MGHIVSRRVFLTACGGAAVAATVPVIGLAAGSSAGGAHPLTLDMFQPLMGEPFTVTHENGGASFRVVLKVAARGRDAFTRDQDGRVVMDGFSLEFAGVPAGEAVQGVHTLHHAAIGEHTLLMTPVADEDDAHRRYEVVMTRMVQA